MATDHSPARPSSARADADEVEAHRPGRWRWAHEWNRAYLLTCAAGLIVDPLFLYTLSVSGPMMCLFVDGWFALTVTVLRCMIDALHVWNAGLKLWVGLRRGPHQQQPAEEERPKEK